MKILKRRERLIPNSQNNKESTVGNARYMICVADQRNSIIWSLCYEITGRSLMDKILIHSIHEAIEYYS